jgi:hypothetical protein
LRTHFVGTTGVATGAGDGVFVEILVGVLVDIVVGVLVEIVFNSFATFFNSSSTALTWPFGYSARSNSSYASIFSFTYAMN